MNFVFLAGVKWSLFYEEIELLLERINKERIITYCYSFIYLLLLFFFTIKPVYYVFKILKKNVEKMKKNLKYADKTTINKRQLVYYICN